MTMLGSGITTQDDGLTITKVEDQRAPGSTRSLESQDRIHALLIHQAFCTPTEAGGTRHYEFGRRIVARGHEFAVVASNLSYLSGQAVEKKDSSGCEWLDGIKVFRAYTYKTPSANFLKRLISMLSFATTSVAAALRAGSPDIVIGTTPPIFQAASACVVASLRRRPLLLEVRDLWPDFAIDMGVLRNPLLIRLSRWLEQILYRHATHLVVNSPAYRESLIGKGVSPDKISLISNGVDAAMFDPAARGEQVRNQLGLEKNFIVTYAGALGIANDIDTILRAADRLRREETGIHFLIVGDGKERKRLQEQARGMSLENATFTGPQPKQRMKDFLAASNACVATLQDIPMFRTTYPNKVFDYMAAGRPTILAIDGVIRDVVERAQGEIFVAPGNDLELANAARKLFHDRHLCERMGASAHCYVIEHFNREDHAQAFLELVVQIAQSGSGSLHKMRRNAAVLF